MNAPSQPRPRPASSGLRQGCLARKEGRRTGSAPPDPAPSTLPRSRAGSSLLLPPHRRARASPCYRRRSPQVPARRPSLAPLASSCLTPPAQGRRAVPPPPGRGALTTGARCLPGRPRRGLSPSAISCSTARSVRRGSAPPRLPSWETLASSSHVGYRLLPPSAARPATSLASAAGPPGRQGAPAPPVLSMAARSTPQPRPLPPLLTCRPPSGNPPRGCPRPPPLPHRPLASGAPRASSLRWLRHSA